MGVVTTTGAFDASGNNTFSIGVPAGASAGNLFVLAIEYTSSATLNWPTGFTEVGSHVSDSSMGATLRVAIKVADGTETGAFSCDTGSNYQRWSGRCALVSGYSAPEQASSQNATLVYATSATLTGASITTTQANSLILWVGGTASPGASVTGTLTQPSGLTTNGFTDSGIGVDCAIASGVQATAGAATYSGSIAFSGAANSYGGHVVTVALSPAGGPAHFAASVGAVSTATASLRVGAKLAASVAALATATAALTVGARFSASPVAVSTASASLKVGAGFASAVSAQSSATAGLTTSINLSGGLAATSSAFADLQTGASLAGSIVSVCSASAGLTTSINMAGSTGATSSSSGALLTQIAMAASAASTSVASATLQAASALSGFAPSVSSASASLATQIQLGGQGFASSVLGGELTTGINLAGAAAVSSSCLASLSGSAAILSGVASSEALAVAHLATYRAVWSGPAPHSWSIPNINRHCVLLERDEQMGKTLKTAIQPVEKRSTETITVDVDARKMLGNGVTLVEVISVAVEPAGEVELSASGAVINTDPTVLNGESVPVGKVVQMVLAGGMAGVNKTGRPYLVRVMCATSRAPEAVELTIPVMVDDYPYLT